MNADPEDNLSSGMLFLLKIAHGTNQRPIPDSYPPLSDPNKSSRSDTILNNTFAKSSGSFIKKPRPKALVSGIYLNSEASVESVSRRDVSSDRSDPNRSKDGESYKSNKAFGSMRHSAAKRDINDPRFSPSGQPKLSVLSDLITRKEEPLHLQKAVPAFILLG